MGTKREYATEGLILPSRSMAIFELPEHQLRMKETKGDTNEPHKELPSRGG